MPDELYDGRYVPDSLPGEPDRRRMSSVGVLATVFFRGIVLLFLAGLTAGLWLPYLLSLLVWGVPPVVPRFRQVRRYLRLTWTVQPTHPTLDLPRRLYLTLSVLRKVVEMPLWGLAWQLDHLLYGRALANTPVVAPLLEISAGRSGSTQIARYLEQDDQLVAPGLLQMFFPYLWLWKLSGATLGRVFTKEQVRGFVTRHFPPEFVQRHELDPFRTDTFEAGLYLAHLNALAMLLGPKAIIDEINFARCPAHNRALWDEVFVDLLDGIGRKTLLHAGPAETGPRRFFAKGHFLVAADALEKRYPRARFLTVVRDPRSRLRSAINYLAVNPVDRALAPIPMSWLTEACLVTELDYCAIEMAWFSRASGAARCVIRFDAFVVDLESCMKRVYAECLDASELPPHVPREHTPRVRHDYLVDRSWEQLGVDEAVLSAKLSDYIAWCTSHLQ